MNCRAKTTVNNSMRTRALITSLLSMAFVAIAASAVRADNSWTVSISEKEMKLDNPVDMMWDKWLMWDIGYQRMICRNCAVHRASERRCFVEPHHRISYHHRRQPFPFRPR